MCCNSNAKECCFPVRKSMYSDQLNRSFICVKTSVLVQGDISQEKGLLV